MGKKSVLLGFVKTVNFVYEKNRAGAEIPVDFGAFDDGLDILFAGSDGRDFDKIGFKFACKNTSEGSLASARRTPKNEINRLAFFTNFSQNFTFANDFVLAENFF